VQKTANAGGASMDGERRSKWHDLRKGVIHRKGKKTKSGNVNFRVLIATVHSSGRLVYKEKK